jgi:hypothetical protein
MKLSKISKLQGGKAVGEAGAGEMGRRADGGDAVKAG